MANEVLVKVGTQIRFFVTGSFSPADAGTNWTIGTPTDVVLTLAGVADGAARQSDKVDLGATRARAYEVLGCVDFTGETPTAGQTVDYYWAPSTSSTQANGNVAGNSGADADAPGGALGSITLAEFLDMCDFIGSLVIHDGAVVQNGLVNPRFEPSSRYGQLVVVDNSGDAFEADDVEMHQVMNPIIDEVQ